MLHPTTADFLTIGLLILLETLLSADNALVLAVMILGLPEGVRKKALNFGLVGAIGLRVVATLLAIYLIKFTWVKAVGGLYLLYLTASHFRSHPDRVGGRTVPEARPAFGLSAFWATVARIQVMNLAFSLDSILVAVAMSPKRWVVITGGMLGIAAMRVVVGQLLSLIQRYPPLVDGAFVIIGWVGIKLMAEYAYEMQWVPWAIPLWFSMALIVVIFIGAYFYARKLGPPPQNN